MTTKEAAEHRLGQKIAETLGLKRVEGTNLFRTGWGPQTPIRLVKTLRIMLKETPNHVVRELHTTNS